MAFFVSHVCRRHLKYIHRGQNVSSVSLLRAFSSRVDKAEDKDVVFRRVLNSFPEGIQMAFAYGSGVFQQTGHQMSNNMLDFIFVVDDSVQWHTDNLIKHRNHYSFLSMLGPKVVASYQDNYAAGVFFNTLVQFEDRLIKYGVVSKKTLVSDLTDWDSLYISGRLHKPVYFIREPSYGDVATAISTNLKSAVHSALLLLPEKFSEEELFIQITRLSYDGDFRMKFGEDKGKVKKIVTPNMQYFCDLYQPVIDPEKHVHWNHSSGLLEQDISSDANLHHLKLLPKNVVTGIQRSFKYMSVMEDSSDNSLDFLLDMISKLDICPDIVGESIARIVGHSSWRQSLKGIATAGITKSVQYSSKKVIKMISGLKGS